MGDSTGSAEVFRQSVVGGRRRSDALASIGEMDPPPQAILPVKTMLTRNGHSGDNDSAATPRNKKQGESSNPNST